MFCWFFPPWKKTSNRATEGKENTKLSFKVVWGFFCCCCVQLGLFACVWKEGLVIFCCGVAFFVWLLSPFKIPERSKQKVTLKVTEDERHQQQRMHRGKGRGSFHPPAKTLSIFQQISLLFPKEFLYLSFIRAFHSYQKPSFLPMAVIKPWHYKTWSV